MAELLINSLFAFDDTKIFETIKLPRTVEEILRIRGKEEVPSDLSYKAIEDLKNASEMCIYGKDYYRGLYYLIVAAELFPYRRDLLKRKNEALNLLVDLYLLEVKQNQDKCRSYKENIDQISKVFPNERRIDLLKQSCKETSRVAKPKIDTPSLRTFNKQLPFEEKSCNAAIVDECRALGALAELNKQFELALKYYNIACIHKDGEGCYRSGRILFENIKTEQESKSFFLKAKNLGVEKVNFELGIMEKNYLNQLTLFKKACDHDVLQSCYRLGELIERPWGVGSEGFKSDQVKALEVYLNACEKGGIDSCHGAATILLNRGKATEAINLYIKSCRMGDHSGCWEAGKLYESLFKDLSEISLAQKYYKLGCHGGWKFACIGKKRLNDFKDGNFSVAMIINRYLTDCSKENDNFSCDRLLELAINEYKRGRKEIAKKIYIEANCPIDPEHKKCVVLKSLNPDFFNIKDWKEIK